MFLFKLLCVFNMYRLELSLHDDGDPDREMTTPLSADDDGRKSREMKMDQNSECALNMFQNPQDCRLLTFSIGFFTLLNF